ncbi:MAG: DegT/DnrJ/EryC1/StrS family aminotransferase [Candidatus Paracaedibacteraceae bacterium]|nr:DegT/DnrJ/EryC1/StrS family aminotransferase [Candidatus Paracaedibacteraceae bacterium]
MEIGSEFWIDKNKVIHESDLLPSWLSRFGDVVLTSSGRGALGLLLNQLKPKNNKALLPSYICESVIHSFIIAGYELIYYDIDKYLIPIDIEFIKNSDVGIFFHMGYFGFLTNDILADIILCLKAESVITIEDVTHVLFSKYNKQTESDFVVGSIRKWFGIPSGGFLASDKIMRYELLDVNVEFINMRRSSLHQKFEYMKSRNESIKDTFLSGFNRAEHMLDEDIKPYKIDHESEMIIKNLDYIELQSNRQRNYKFLLKHLRDVDGIEVIFNDLKSDVTPMFFPIYVKSKRDELRRKLIESEIYCPVHWPIPKHVNGQLNITTENVYDSILSIPCDQRYQIEDMSRIINEIVSFFEE